MNWLAALALTFGIALLAAGLVVALAKASTTPTHQTPTTHLRANDAADQLATRIGDDDQFRRWRTVVTHIRRNANAENAATEGDPRS